MSRVINDISAVRVMLGPGVLNFVNAPLYYVYAVALMLSMDVRMTLAALAPFPLLMYVARKFRGRIMKSSLEVQQQMSVLSSHVQENLSGMHVVKAYAQEDFQTQQFIALNKDYEVKSMEMAKMRGIVNPVMQGINGLTVLIVIWYGGMRVMRGDLLVADIVAFIAYLNVLAWPTAAFGWMLSLVERGRAAMRRLEEILETKPEIADAADREPVGALKKGIEFRDVSFAYERQRNGHAALEGDRFHAAGRTLGGSGRPDRLRQKHAGAAGAAAVRCFVRRDSHRRAGYSRTLSLRDLRKMIGYVPQEPFLVFHFAQGAILPSAATSIREEELARAVEIARLDRDLEIFPQASGHAGRRARRHAFRRPKAARDLGARA